jgi:hypothetical protein
MSQGNDGDQALPRPSVVVAKAGTPSHELSPKAIKGILVNPIYAGLGPFPPIVSDLDWVRACASLIKQDGAEQFLVNLLYVLRESLNEDLLQKVRDTAASAKTSKSIVVGPPQANAPRMTSEIPKRPDDERQVGHSRLAARRRVRKLALRKCERGYPMKSTRVIHGGADQLLSSRFPLLRPASKSSAGQPGRDEQTGAVRASLEIETRRSQSVEESRSGVHRAGGYLNRLEIAGHPG